VSYRNNTVYAIPASRCPLSGENGNVPNGAKIVCNVRNMPPQINRHPLSEVNRNITYVGKTSQINVSLTNLPSKTPLPVVVCNNKPSNWS